jgi:hypothetical protein
MYGHSPSDQTISSVTSPVPVRPDGSAGQAPGGLGELTPCSSIVLVAPFIDVLRGNATVDRALSAITAAMADVV